jgi:Ca2+-binding EF-hand superfamily protein
VEIVLPDFNEDGRVDASDLDIICEAFGSCKSDEKWNPTCDVNNDGKINIIDVAVTAKAFGKVAPQ